VNVSEEVAPIPNLQPQDTIGLKDELYEETLKPEDPDLVRINIVDEVDELDPKLNEEKERFAVEESKTRETRGIYYKECRTQHDCYPGYCMNFKCYNGIKGDPCAGTWDCKESLLCLDHECDRGGAGVDCDYDEQCKKGFDCVNYKCEKVTSGGGGDKVGEGGACDSASDCKKDFYCYKQKCYNGSKGDPCSKNSECQAGGKIGYCHKRECMYDEKSSHYQYEDYWYSKDYKEDHWYDYDYGEVGDYCILNIDCRGGNYCMKHKCRDGSRGDPCRNSLECKGYSKCRFFECH